MPKMVFNISTSQKGSKQIIMSEVLLEIPDEFAVNVMKSLGDARGGITIETTVGAIFDTTTVSDNAKSERAQTILEKFALYFWGKCVYHVFKSIQVLGLGLIGYHIPRMLCSM